MGLFVKYGPGSRVHWDFSLQVSVAAKYKGSFMYIGVAC